MRFSVLLSLGEMDFPKASLGGPTSFGFVLETTQRWPVIFEKGNDLMVALIFDIFDTFDTFDMLILRHGMVRLATI